MLHFGQVLNTMSKHTVYNYFSIAVLTNYHKFTGLNEHKFILL